MHQECTTLHKREFTLTVEFTDQERERFFEHLMWQGDIISDAIISEVTRTLEKVGLRPTVVRMKS